MHKVQNPRNSRITNGIPPQALVDASHGDRLGEVSDVFALILVLTFAIIMSVVAISIEDFPGILEAFLIPWISVAHAGLYFWYNRNSEKNKYNCSSCADRKCSDQGKVKQLPFCDKWTAKPGRFFGQILVTSYSGISIVFFIFTQIFWSQILALFLVTIFCNLSVAWWIFTGINHNYSLNPKSKEMKAKKTGYGVAVCCSMCISMLITYILLLESIGINFF